MSLVTTRGRSHHGVEVVVRRRLRFLRVEHGDALHFFVPDTFFQQLRLNKQFVAHPSAMASAIVAMIAANRLLTTSFVSRKDSGGNPSPDCPMPGHFGFIFDGRVETAITSKTRCPSATRFDNKNKGSRSCTAHSVLPRRPPTS